MEQKGTLPKQRFFPATLTPESLNHMRTNGGHMGEHIGIEFTEIGDDYMVAKMPVDHRTRQPMGLLHGGASVALAETLGSVAALFSAGENKSVVGLEINANHIRSVKEGWVYGTVRPLHVGRTTHVWEIKITDEQVRLVCVSRLTVAILDKKAEA
jgi:1,4-dihydroxy-2-naphthoyl-CoA hydrolase